jgi:hypothetical protein
MMDAAARSMSSPEVAVGLTLSLLMVGEVLPMMLSVMDGAMSMAALVTVSIMVSIVVVGEGAGESVDPDLVVPTVGAN